MAGEEEDVHCKLCGYTIPEDMLGSHIRDNHMIRDKNILRQMINLHYEADDNAVATQTSLTWVHEQYFIDSSGEGNVEGEGDVVESNGDVDGDGVVGVAGDNEVVCTSCFEVEGSPMIQCKHCESWYHSTCVDTDKVEEEEWHCHKCNKRDNDIMPQPTLVVPASVKGIKRLMRDGDDSCNDVKVTAVVKPTRKEILEKITSPEGGGGVRPVPAFIQDPSCDSPANKVASSSPFEVVVESGDNEVTKGQSDSQAVHLDDVEPNDHLDQEDQLGPESYSDHGDLSDDANDPLAQNSDDSHEIYRDKDQKSTNNRGNDSLRHKRKGKKTKRLEKKKAEEENGDTAEKEAQPVVIAPVKKELSNFYEIQSPKIKCQFCCLGKNSGDVELGILYGTDGHQAHWYCLIFSSNLIQGGEDHEGIYGFLPADINAELARGSELNCSYCFKSMATVGCCQPLCPSTYHLPCGIENGAVSEFYGKFDSYCATHKHRRTRHPKRYVLTDIGLVPDSKDAEADGETIPASNAGNKNRRHKRQPQKDRTKAKKRKHQEESSSNSSRGREIKRPRQYDDYVTDNNPQGSRSKNPPQKSDNQAESTRGRPARSRRAPANPNNIYMSATEELAKILSNKYESIEKTFEDYSGKKRQRSGSFQSAADKPSVRQRRRHVSSDSSGSGSGTDSSFSDSVAEQSQAVRKKEQMPKQKPKNKTVEKPKRRNPAPVKKEKSPTEERETVENIEKFLSNSSSSHASGRVVKSEFGRGTRGCVAKQEPPTTAAIAADKNVPAAPPAAQRNLVIPKWEPPSANTSWEAAAPPNAANELPPQEYRDLELVRYRCTECSFTAFDKDESVAHVAEGHLQGQSADFVKQIMQIVIKKCVLRSPTRRRLRDGLTTSSLPGGDATETPDEPVFQCLECHARMKVDRQLVMHHLRGQHSLNLWQYADRYLSGPEKEAWSVTFENWHRELAIERTVDSALPDSDGHLECTSCTVTFEEKDDLANHLTVCKEFQDHLTKRNSSSKKSVSFLLLHSTLL